MSDPSALLRDRRCAVVTIDLHRGHLDPKIATMPLPADRSAKVVARNQVLLDAARTAGLPVVHVVTRYRDVTEVTTNPFWASLNGTDATRSNAESHQIEPTRGTELMPGLLDPAHDVVIDTKKRYDAFLATDLSFVLDAHDIDTLLITGVNTNSCVLTTTIVASTRDYACVVISDCVDTMDGDTYHRNALAMIERAFGWVMSTDEAVATLRTLPSPAKLATRT